METKKKLLDKTLAIIEPREEYQKDKTWSFWKTEKHNFEDCIKKEWNKFKIKIPNKTKTIECNDNPYQTIDSGLFYEKIIKKLDQNHNIKFFKNKNHLDLTNSLIFNSVPEIKSSKGIWF